MSDDTPFTELAVSVGRACMCVRVQRASRAIGRRYDEALRPVGLTNWQFSMLMVLHRRDPATVGELADRLAMDRTTTTANLKPLERRGLVESRRDDKDGRVRRIILTDAGLALLEQAVPHWKTVNDEVVADLKDLDLKNLRAALGVIASN